MIIGISGKARHGKDSVAEIIQKLLPNHNWEIKRFADTLKDMVCLLIGCSREQLENQEFKEKELGEEWWCYKGRYGDLIPYSDNSKRNDEDLIKTTPRLLLQLLGTDFGRKLVHPNIWCNSLMSKYKAHIEGYPNLIYHNGNDLIEGKQYSMGKAVYPSWLIADVRFPNEVESIKKRGGIVVRVNRTGFESTDTHESEVALDDYKDFDYTINAANMEELQQEVKKMLNKLQLI